MNIRSRQVALVFFALAYLFLFVLRVEILLVAEAAQTLPNFAGKTVEVEGMVVNDPDRRETSLHVNIKVNSINGATASGAVLAFLNRDEKVSYGDAVAVSGVLAAPQPFETDTGHTFDYPNYLRVQGISMLMQRATFLSDNRGGVSLQGSLFALKHWFEQSIEKLFPEPDNSLLEGILLGERGGIPKSLNDAFISSGLVHIVALSGYNLSIVAIGVLGLLSFLRGSVRFSTSATVMILFALMTGAGATTVRALIMALIALLARATGRSALALRSLAVAALAMALWNPLIVLYDPSFILSVLATFGLITLVPWVELYLPKFLLRFKTLREIIASTIAVQLFVFPALLYFTGVLSFLSVPANVLALPMVPFAMLGGFIAGILGFIHPALAFAPALVSDSLLKWIMFVARLVASVPFGTAIIPAFSAWIVIAAYVPLTSFAISKHVQTEPPSRTN